MYLLLLLPRASTFLTSAWHTLLQLLHLAHPHLSPRTPLHPLCELCPNLQTGSGMPLGYVHLDRSSYVGPCAWGRNHGPPVGPSPLLEGRVQAHFEGPENGLDDPDVGFSGTPLGPP